MKRHTITLGAATTAGGKVISASSTGSINGAPIALEGDVIFCPACKSQGRILCIEPRIPETWNGKKVALENDLCACACPNPPRLIRSQSIRFQDLGGAGEGGAPIDSPTSASRESEVDLAFDDKFIVLDDDTGEPLPNTEYAIRRLNGQVEFGITDSAGHTHLLSATAESESVDIFL